MKVLDIKKFPKVELHCHLDGSISAETVMKIAKHDNIEIPNDVNLLKEMLHVKENCKSLAEYLEKFDLPITCLQTSYGLETAAYELLKEVRRENVIYIEVRFAPIFSLNETMQYEDVIEAVLQGLKRGREDFGVYSSLILCGMRHMNPEESLILVELASKYRDLGVGGIDLAGGEAEFPPQLFDALFNKAKESNIKFTIHSGETGSYQNVQYAIEKGAKRVGHGVAVLNDTGAVNQSRENNLVFELCPTSNFQTKAIEIGVDYPINQFLEHGLKVSINTDNRVVSNTNLMKEFLVLQKFLDITPEFMRNVMMNAIEVAFTTEDIKGELKKLITRDFL